MRKNRITTEIFLEADCSVWPKCFIGMIQQFHRYTVQLDRYIYIDINIYIYTYVRTYISIQIYYSFSQYPGMFSSPSCDHIQKNKQPLTLTFTPTVRSIQCEENCRTRRTPAVSFAPDHHIYKVLKSVAMKSSQELYSISVVSNLFWFVTPF